MSEQAIQQKPQLPPHVVQSRKIMSCKDFMPLWSRIAFYILLMFVYQFTGGVYMSSVTQMSGSLVWMNEDVMMAGYASLIGMTMIFPLQFKIMFRFENRSTLIVSTIVLMAGTVITGYSDCIPLVVAASFISGMFKMIATFYCISNIQLNITPTRDLAVFYPFLYTIILSCIQLSGIAAGYSIWAYDWQHIHLIMTGVLAIALLLVVFFTRRHFRLGPYIPFYGVDYTGVVLWSATLLCALFVCVYGEHYDWWYSEKICLATFLTLLFLVLSIRRAAVVRHPFINLKTFRQPKVFILCMLFLVYCVMNATTGNIQNIFTEGILGFDTFHAISLNWPVVAGIICGTAFSYAVLNWWKWRPRYLAMIGFAFFTLYELSLYYLIDTSTEMYQLYAPMWCRGFGNAVLYVVLAYTLGKNVPFPYYFMALCVAGFVRTGVGTPFGTAIFTRILNVVRKESLMHLSEGFDLANPAVQNFGTVYGELQKASLMIGLKEVFWYAALLGIITILGLLVSDLRGKMPGVIPSLSKIWKITKLQ